MPKISMYARNGKPVTTARPRLRPIFDEANSLYFDGSLPDEIELEWNTRFRVCAGRCKWFWRYRSMTDSEKAIRPSWLHNRLIKYPKNMKIELSVETFKNCNYNLKEVQETMIHEMVHAWQAYDGMNGNHGWQFQAKMASIMQDGRSDYTYHHIDLTGLRNRSQW